MQSLQMLYNTTVEYLSMACTSNNQKIVTGSKMTTFVREIFKKVLIFTVKNLSEKSTMM